MAWARFTGDFDFRLPGGSWTVAYREGTARCVRRVCLNMAVAQGKAVAMMPPPRHIAERLKADPRWKGDTHGPGFSC